MKQVFAAASSFVVGCSGAVAIPQTDQPLINEVVALEGDGATCVTFDTRGSVAKVDPDGPPGMMTPDRFKNRAARAAAKAIAIGWRDAPDSRHRTVGTVDGDRCLMFVSGPATSGDFAFLFFSDPGGERGAYAFQRAGEHWEVVEKVRLGFW